MKRKALAQIPLILGLFVMAVAIPVATKLVQQNQDTRNKAASVTCGSSGTISQCGSKGGCATGYRCLPNGCSYDPACGGFVPTNTPKPPTATPTVNPPRTCIPDGGCRTVGGLPCCNYENPDDTSCGTGIKCVHSKPIPPTSRPTSTPTPTPTCIQDGNCLLSGRNCCSGNMKSDPLGCTTGTRCGGYSCQTDAGSGVCRSTGCLNTETDKGQSNCASGRCCIPKPTATPTVKPSCSNNGVTCSINSQCCSNHCVTGICVANCSANGTTCTIDMQCCSSHCVAGKCSATAASPTPTKKPSPTPTKKPSPTSVPCATTGQSCTTRSCCNAVADVCTDEGLSYPRCVPRNQIPTYIPVPTISCAKSGQACSTKPCCEPYLDVCTDEGLSYPRCVPRSQIPTYIPVPTQMPCAVTGGSCSSSLGCCAMSDKCTSGKCIAPTPTSTNPTSGPNPPTSGPIPTTGGCSGSKPADKCTDPKTLYINAQCVNNQWDWNEQLCNSAGRKESCGGKEYCCPSAGGAWTTDMAKCPTSKCTQCSGKPNAKASGDADCSGITNLVDYSIWREEYLSTQCGNHIMILPSWKADFNCDGLVTLADYDIWKNKYLEIFK